MEREFFLADEAESMQVGRQLGELALQQRSGLCVYLHGGLGAGKTTLARAWLAGMGYRGKVRSPTYTLLEPYEVEDFDVDHMDLYRLADPEELEFLGIRDISHDTGSRHRILLVEWPENGGALLPPVDLDIYLEPQAEGRKLLLGGRSEPGDRVIRAVDAMHESQI